MAFDERYDVGDRAGRPIGVKVNGWMAAHVG